LGGGFPSPEPTNRRSAKPAVFPGAQGKPRCMPPFAVFRLHAFQMGKTRLPGIGHRASPGRLRSRSFARTAGRAVTAAALLHLVRQPGPIRSRAGSSIGAPLPQPGQGSGPGGPSTATPWRMTSWTRTRASSAAPSATGYVAHRPATGRKHRGAHGSFAMMLAFAGCSPDHFRRDRQRASGASNGVPPESGGWAVRPPGVRSLGTPAPLLRAPLGRLAERPLIPPRLPPMSFPGAGPR